MLEDEVTDVGVVCEFEDVLAEVVHALEVSVVGVVEGEGVEDFDHLAAEGFVPA
jgi:hypothetical protein